MGDFGPAHLFVGDLKSAVGELHGGQGRGRVGCCEANQHRADGDCQGGDHLRNGQREPSVEVITLTLKLIGVVGKP